jgi:hypothetical protein
MTGTQWSISIMQHETIKDYITVIVVAIVGALALLHSLDALFV